jgi:hypothetical protein
MVGQVMQYFAMESGTLFVPYLALQKCKHITTTTGAGATYNYLNQAAPTQAAVTTTSIQQDILVGVAAPEAASAAPHQGGCNIYRDKISGQIRQYPLSCQTYLS